MAGKMLCQAQLPALWNRCGLNNICFTLLLTVPAWLKQSFPTIQYLHSPPSSTRDINSRGRGGRRVKTSDATVLRWEDYKATTSKSQHELLPRMNSGGKHHKMLYPNAIQSISSFFLFLFLITVKLKVLYWIYWYFSVLLHKPLKHKRCIKIKARPLQWQ